MDVGHLKGAFLEYVVRRLFVKCGFRAVKPDDVFVYERSPLTYIQGRGAAHDADVLMDPPIQFPFSYPIRIVFECKNYGKNVGLPVVRNALGLRTDINDFEIVTEEFLQARKNNRRASIAVETRNRYFYQVGIAAVNHFAKPAMEFAVNNKIPLLSLAWFVGPNTRNTISSLEQAGEKNWF